MKHSQGCVERFVFIVERLSNGRGARPSRARHGLDSAIARQLLRIVLNPGERSEILLGAAEQWEYAGDVDRAAALLGGLLALGDDAAAYARYSLAQLCFDHGAKRTPGHQRALEQSESSGGKPAELVAELLEQRGEHEAALR